MDGTKYKGIRFTQNQNRSGRRVDVYRTLEFHTHPHAGYNPHWQMNTFSYYNGAWHRESPIARWTLWLINI